MKNILIALSAGFVLGMCSGLITSKLGFEIPRLVEIILIAVSVGGTFFILEKRKEAF